MTFDLWLAVATGFGLIVAAIGMVAYGVAGLLEGNRDGK